MTDYSLEATWRPLIFGSYGIKTVQQAVNDARWQGLRVAMQNTPLESRFLVLSAYVHARSAEDGEARRVRVTNYIHALKRGGMIR